MLQTVGIHAFSLRACIENTSKYGPGIAQRASGALATFERRNEHHDARFILLMEGCSESLLVVGVTAIDQERRLCSEFAVICQQEPLHRRSMSDDQFVDEIRQNAIVRQINRLARATSDVGRKSIIIHLDAYGHVACLPQPLARSEQRGIIARL